MTQRQAPNLFATALLAAGLLLSVTGPASPAATAKTQQPAPKSPGWVVNCVNAGNGLACKASQTIVLAKTRQLLLSVSISRPSGANDPAMLLQLPHGLFIPAGVTIGVDTSKPEALQIQTCDAKGCYAGAPVTAERLAAMRKGADLKVTFQDMKKQKIVVSVSLQGFSAAFAKL